MSLLFPFTANALSATTALTIEGTKPYLLLSDGTTKLTTLNELLGFKMPKRNGDTGTEQIDASMAGTTLTVPAGMKYSDVVALITADGNSRTVVGTVVGDNDGDATIPANTSVTGTMTATWYKGTVNAANKVTDLTQGLMGGCDGTDYLLEISANGVQANTTYGAPNINAYGNGGPITYTFKAPISPGGCIKYLKPGSMQIYTTGVSIPGGYNTAKFDTTNGFKVNSGFPSTGFEKAVFSVIGSGADQKKYRCSSPDNIVGGKIVLSGTSSTNLGKDCTVTYNKTTKADFTSGGMPTITLEYSADGSTGWAAIDTFTIPTPTKWAIGKGASRYKADDDSTTSGVFEAANLCAGKTGAAVTTDTMSAADAGKYFFSRNELTNTPIANQPAANQVIGGKFSRDADGTFMGEWGSVRSYTGSGWVSGVYSWTAEVYPTTHQFLVSTNHGGVDATYPMNPVFVAMCKG